MDTKRSHEEAAKHLSLAFKMYEVATEMMRDRYRHHLPNETEDEIQARVTAWLHERPGAEQGDGRGRPGTWPRSQK